MPHRQTINFINRTISNRTDRFVNRSYIWSRDESECSAGGTLRTTRNTRDTLRGTLANGDVYIGGTVRHDDGNESYVARYRVEDIITPYNLCTPLTTIHAPRWEKSARTKEKHMEPSGISIPFFPSVLCKDVPNTRKVRTLRPATTRTYAFRICSPKIADVRRQWRVTNTFLSLFLAFLRETRYPLPSKLW